MSTYTTRAQPTVAASIQTHRNSIHHETHTVDLSRKALSLLFPSPYMASPPHSESPFRLFEDTKRLPSASNAHARSWVPHMQVRAPAPHAESTHRCSRNIPSANSRPIAHSLRHNAEVRRRSSRRALLDARKIAYPHSPALRNVSPCYSL